MFGEKMMDRCTWQKANVLINKKTRVFLFFLFWVNSYFPTFVFCSLVKKLKLFIFHKWRNQNFRLNVHNISCSF